MRPLGDEVYIQGPPGRPRGFSGRAGVAERPLGRSRPIVLDPDRGFEEPTVPAVGDGDPRRVGRVREGTSMWRGAYSMPV